MLLGGPEITADNDWVLREHGGGPITRCSAKGSDLRPVEAWRREPAAAAIAGLWKRRPGSFRRRDSRWPTWTPSARPILKAFSTRPTAADAPGDRARLPLPLQVLLLSEELRSRSASCRSNVEANLRHADRARRRGGVPARSDAQPAARLRRVAAAAGRGNPERRFAYSAELRAEGIDAQIARLLAEANFQEVEIGLQSVDPRAQQLMGRPVNLAAFEQGAGPCWREGIRVRMDLILGLPGDTADSIRRGFDYLDAHRPFTRVQVFNLSILPGTAFRREAERSG